MYELLGGIKNGCSHFSHFEKQKENNRYIYGCENLINLKYNFYYTFYHLKKREKNSNFMSSRSASA